MGVIVAIVGSNEASRASIVAALDAAPSDWILQLHREPPESADVIVCDPGVSCTRDALVFDGENDLIARISERVARPGRTVLVSGPSGGLGVTSVALHLAAAFARCGHKTGVVDLDPQRGARARLGIDPAPEPDAPVPVAGAFHLLPSCAMSTHERTVIDAPRASITEMGAPDAGVLVCCPSPQGARRAREMLEVHPDIGWHVVLNRLGPGGETTRTQLERVIGRPVMELPCCAALRDAEDDGRLVRRGWTRWSRGIERLRARLDA